MVTQSVQILYAMILRKDMASKCTAEFFSNSRFADDVALVGPSLHQVIEMLRDIERDVRQIGIELRAFSGKRTYCQTVSVNLSDWDS